jgi:predicted transposase/invertase (TIGR01784 family)
MNYIMSGSANIKEARRLLSFDYALKRLLRQKVNYDILEGFLSELLGRSIKINNILEGESQQDKLNDKQTRVDIFAEDKTGELMIIEVQYQFEIDYLLRVLFGVSRNIFDFIQKGNPYKEIRKVYSISIIFFKEFHNDNEYIYHGKTDFKGMHTGKILTLTAAQQKVFGKLEAGDLHPEYYLLDVTNFDDVAKNTLDEWIYYLKNNRVKDNFTALGLDKVREILDYDSLSPAEQRSYDKAIDIKLGWDSAIESAKMEGKIEGEAERAQLQQDLAAKDAALAVEKEKIADALARIAELEKQLKMNNE